jgi:hypothetical protein
MNKASNSKGLYRGLGSIDIAAAARSVLLIGRLRDNPSIRVMTHLKSSLAPEGCSIAFEIVADGGFRWIGPYDVTADDLLGGVQPVEDSKLDKARSTLLTMLEQGQMPCVDIYEHFRELDISERTVDTAKRILKIKSIKNAGGWHWSL